MGFIEGEGRHLATPCDDPKTSQSFVTTSSAARALGRNRIRRWSPGET